MTKEILMISSFAYPFVGEVAARRKRAPDAAGRYTKPIICLDQLQHLYITEKTDKQH